MSKWGSGQASKYDPEHSCQMAYDVLCEGGGIAKVAARCGVSISAVQNWMDKYPDFKEAYNLGIAAGQAQWEDWYQEALMSGAPMNEKGWQALLKHRYRWDKVRLKGLASGEHLKNMKSIFDQATTDGMTPAEITAAVELVKNDIAVDTHVKIEPELEEIKRLVKGNSQAS